MSLTAFSYARVASQENADERIHAQLQTIRDFAEKEGVKIIEEFCDQGSGLQEGEGLSRMIEAIRFVGKRPDYVYVYDYDRLSRDYPAMFALLDGFKELEVELIPIIKKGNVQ